VALDLDQERPAPRWIVNDCDPEARLLPRRQRPHEAARPSCAFRPPHVPAVPVTPAPQRAPDLGAVHSPAVADRLAAVWVACQEDELAGRQEMVPAVALPAAWVSGLRSRCFVMPSCIEKRRAASLPQEFNFSNPHRTLVVSQFETSKTGMVGSTQWGLSCHSSSR
jgi:hypothetical protein